MNQRTQPVKLRYFALLREQRGLDAEMVETRASTPRELYREIAATHGFTLPEDRVGVAVVCAWRASSAVFLCPLYAPGGLSSYFCYPREKRHEPTVSYSF